MSQADLDALTRLVQAVVLLVTAVAALYGAIRGHQTAAKVASVASDVAEVKTQTNGLVAATIASSGDAGYAAGAAGQPNPTVRAAVDPTAPDPMHPHLGDLP